MTNTQTPWSYKKIISKCKKEIDRPYYPSAKDFYYYFHRYDYIPIDSVKHIFKLVNICWNDSGVYKATNDLYKSIKDLIYDNCDWRDHEYNPKYNPRASVSIRESSFLNAFKAIESLLGGYFGPRSSNKDNIRKRLVKFGFDPDEICGYKDKDTIMNKIIKYWGIRDNRAAHGRTYNRKKNILVGSIIDLQNLAHTLICYKMANKYPK